MFLCKMKGLGQIGLLQYSVLHFNEKDIACSPYHTEHIYTRAVYTADFSNIELRVCGHHNWETKECVFIVANPWFLIKLKMKNISYKNQEYF